MNDQVEDFTWSKPSKLKHQAQTIKVQTILVQTIKYGVR